MTGVGLKNFRLTCETDNFEHAGTDRYLVLQPRAQRPISKCSRRRALIVGLTLFLVLIILILKDIAAGWRPSHPDFPLDRRISRLADHVSLAGDGLEKPVRQLERHAVLAGDRPGARFGLTPVVPVGAADRRRFA